MPKGVGRDDWSGQVLDYMVRALRVYRLSAPSRNYLMSAGRGGSAFFWLFVSGGEVGRRGLLSVMVGGFEVGWGVMDGRGVPDYAAQGVAAFILCLRQRGDYLMSARWGVMTAGKCWTTRSGRCRVRTSGKRWARSPPPGEELSDVWGVGRFCFLLVVRFWW